MIKKWFFLFYIVLPALSFSLVNKSDLTGTWQGTVSFLNTVTWQKSQGNLDKAIQKALYTLKINAIKDDFFAGNETYIIKGTKDLLGFSGKKYINELHDVTIFGIINSKNPLTFYTVKSHDQEATFFKCTAEKAQLDCNFVFSNEVHGSVGHVVLTKIKNN